LRRCRRLGQTAGTGDDQADLVEGLHPGAGRPRRDLVMPRRGTF